MENKFETKGTLLPNKRALEYLRKQFVASAKMQGRIGTFEQVRTFNTEGVDKYFTYEDKVIVPYHLNEYPSRKLLTRYGWFSEDMESLPIILTLTYLDIDDKPIKIDEGALITLSANLNTISNDLDTIKFIITEVRSDLELNQAVCKITPHREEQKENVKVIATADDPILENVYINRKLYYTEPDSTEEE